MSMEKLAYALSNLNLGETTAHIVNGEIVAITQMCPRGVIPIPVFEKQMPKQQGPLGFHRKETGGVGICGSLNTKTGRPCHAACGPRGGPCGRKGHERKREHMRR